MMEASMVVLQQNSDSVLEPTLTQRVNELLCSYEDRPLLSTMGTHGAIAELAARNRGLERALREIALEIQNLTAPH
jgi:hypothetical protein